MDIMLEGRSIVNATDDRNSSDAPVSYNPAQEQFRRELHIVVSKHLQYLHEVDDMDNIEPTKLYLAIKRSLDIFVSLIGLLLLVPILPILAAVIKIDSRGPVFYSQERVGKNRKLFKMYKLRTMVVDAEHKTGPVWATDNDPRVTYVGRFLRKSKIDELPQLLNMLKGEMSMVGPRPERPFFVNYFAEVVPGYSRRFDTIPGITGLAQLRNGYDRYAIDVIRKLRFDITYMKKMGLKLDLMLLTETVLSTLRGRL